MSIMYDYNRSEEILDQVYSKFPELKEYKIKIIFSDEFLQIHKDFQSDKYSNAKVPIDRFLGEYNHENKTIFIYLQGINLIFKGWFEVEKFQLLLKIVVLHKIANFWLFNYKGFDRELINYKEFCPIEISSFNYEQLGLYLSRYQLVLFWAYQMFAYYSLENDSERELMLDICNEYLNKDYNIFISDVSDKKIDKLNFLQLYDFKAFCKLFHINHFLSYIVHEEILNTHSLHYNPNEPEIAKEFNTNGFENRIVKLLEFLRNAKFDKTKLDESLLEIQFGLNVNKFYLPIFQKIIKIIEE